MSGLLKLTLTQVNIFLIYKRNIRQSIWIYVYYFFKGLEESSQILKRLLPRMIDDAFKLSIDELYKYALK